MERYYHELDSFYQQTANSLKELTNSISDSPYFKFYNLINKSFDKVTASIIADKLNDAFFMDPKYGPIMNQVISHLNQYPESKKFFKEYIKNINIAKLKQSLIVYSKLKWDKKPDFIPFYFWYIWYEKIQPNNKHLTIVDYSWYSKNGNRKWYLFVIDMQTKTVKIKSDCGVWRWSETQSNKLKFSNVPWSLQSSLWFFKTPTTATSNSNGTWTGLFLKWMEPWINDNANNNDPKRSRWIALHPVGSIINEKNEQTSEWCITIPWWKDGISAKIIQTIKRDSLIFSYYPQPEYFIKSKKIK